jgi:nucleotide-binding universal stress UspA family protein
MLPVVEPSSIPHDSERLVYEALQALPADFTILHSYPWLRPERGAGGDVLLEGEADFVVLHRELGLLVLEVKGGELRLQDHQWYRQLGSGLKKIKNPFQQARSSMHTLLDVIEQRTRAVTRQHLVYSHAVIFPHQETAGPLPPDASPALVITRTELPQLATRIPEAMRSFGRKPPLSERDFRLVLDALLPRFRVYRPLGVDIDTEAKRLLELTDTQRLVFEGLYSNSRLLVEGAAGTGKTFLALERAMAFAREGVKTLFVCYNRELALWAAEQLEKDDTRRPLKSHLQVIHFHALATRLAREAGVEFTVPTNPAEAAHFWREEAPRLLEQALGVLPESRSWGALIVDEAQDFDELWWYALLELLEDRAKTPIYVFMDRHQSLFGPQPPPPFALETRFELKTNCRNTRRIATTSANLLPLPVNVLPHAPRGVEPRVVRAASTAQQRGLVQAEVRRLLTEERLRPDQVVLLGPATWERGSLSEVRTLEGVQLTNSAAEWRQGGRLLCTTARTFKGLEADVVVLYDVGGLGALFTDADLYVACTRARHRLIIVVHDTTTRERLETAMVTREEP